MRFIVDECAGPAVALWLHSLGHDVYSVFDSSQGMTDDEVLSLAYAENRVLITNDKDFGEMIFRERRQHRGVIFLRLGDERSANKIRVIARILQVYETRIENAFITATETRVRIS